MWRWLPVALIAACAKDAPPAPERLPAPVQVPVIALPPPPPPPPPPPVASPRPPPAAVAAFLEQRARDREPWRATCDGKSLSAAAAAELARRLGENTSYVGGDYGCVGQPVRYEIARGGARFEFAEDCGHMTVGTDTHAAMFSTDMVEFLRRTRGD